MKKYLLITTLFAFAIPSNTQASDHSFAKGLLVGIAVTGVIGGYAAKCLAELHAAMVAEDKVLETVNFIKKQIPGQENSKPEYPLIMHKGFFPPDGDFIIKHIKEQDKKIKELEAAKGNN